MSNESELNARHIDPILNLSVPSPASSLCFLSRRDNSPQHQREYQDADDSSSDASDSSEEEIEFRSSRLQTESNTSSSKFESLLSNRFLTSCHQDGSLLLWDLARRENTAQISLDGNGMTVKRTEAPHNIMYQRRDVNGTVSILDTNQFSILEQYETYSQTFCLSAPCTGDENLLALPSRQDNTLTVIDRRDKIPVYIMPIENHGMLTSLAMSVSGGGSQRPMIACGMESGSVIFHHLNQGHASNRAIENLSKDPVLALDLIPSFGTKDDSSVLAIAGLAGDATEVGELSKPEQGRVALLKATHCTEDDWDIRLRARPSTCRVDETSYGKPGVSICKFRPDDGRLFAVGGWDQRIRLFERSQGKPMAIFRGHKGSVNGLDWAPDTCTSGLLASAGGSENRIYLWQCYGKDKK